MAPWLAGEGLLSTTNQTVTDRAAGRAVGQPCVCVCVCMCTTECHDVDSGGPVGPVTRPCRVLLSSLSECPLCHPAFSPLSLALSLSLLLNLLRPTWSFIFLSVSLTIYLLLSSSHTVSLSHTLSHLSFSSPNCEFICVNLVDVTVIKTECVFLSSWVLISGNGSCFHTV